MTLWEKACAMLLALLILITVASYLPTFHQVQWALRVGVPEMGLLFLVPALPAALWLGRTHLKAALGAITLLTVLVAIPLVQAVELASRLQQNWRKSWSYQPDRSPLNLGSRHGHTKTSEEYKPGLLWDRYTPEAAPKARLLFVHGGSWRSGTREDFPQLLEYLADRGIEAISLSYTLSDTAPYPAAVEDIEVAIEKAYSEEVPLFLAGRSSGGHLALLASYLHPDKVKGVIGLYPPVDMLWSYQHPSNPAVLDSQEAILQFMRRTPEQDPVLYDKSSPIDRVRKNGPPTLLIQGRADSLVYIKQSEMLAERLQKLGVKHYLIAVPWMEHGGDVFLYGPSGRITAWAMEGFMGSLIPAATSSP